MEHYYQVLNLAPTAGINDIKKAYRKLAKQFHPDTAQLGPGDARRFQEIYEAYKALMCRHEDYSLGGSQTSTAARADFRSPDPDGWRFEGVYDEGIDVVYIIKLPPTVTGHGLRFSLPSKKEKACPRCLGIGYSYEPQSLPQNFERVACPRCQTRGVVSHNTVIEVEIPLEALKKGEYRLKGWGHYDPSRARRGDLVMRFEIETDPSAFKTRRYHA